MNLNLERLSASIEAQTTVVASVETLITELRKELKEVADGCKTPAEVQAKVDSLMAQAETNRARLATALIANTEVE